MFRYVPGEQLTEQCKIYYSEKWKKNIYTNIGGDAAAAVVVAGADDHGDDDNHSGGGGGDYDDGDNGNKDNAAWVLGEIKWIIFGLLEVVFTKDFARAT